MAEKKGGMERGSKGVNERSRKERASEKKRGQGGGGGQGGRTKKW